LHKRILEKKIGADYIKLIRMYMFLAKDFKLTPHRIIPISLLKKYSSSKEKINLILLIWHSDGIMKHILTQKENFMCVRKRN